MRIGVDMLSGASTNLYDTAILVSGDGDLAEAVKAVKNLGKHVEVACLYKGKSYEIQKEADVFRLLTESDMQPFYVGE